MKSSLVFAAALAMTATLAAQEKERVANAALRQRNCYFTSSDAAFCDRYEASVAWDRVRRGAVAVEGGWRVYSGGPGLFVDLLIRRLAGRKQEKRSKKAV